MTNGEKILNGFSNATIRRCKNEDFTYIEVEQNDKWIADFDIEWWEAECKEPTTQERQAESDKFDAAFQDGYNNGYAQARFDYEQEPRWIPVSERLPEEREWIGTKRFGTTISDEVYVTLETSDGERFTKHLFFQNGELSQRDRELMGVWFKEVVPIAWMPLPQPYKEVEE